MILASVDFFRLILNKTVQRNCQDVVNSIVKIHHKNLQKILKNEVLPFRNDKVITNLSKYCQSDNKVNLLKNGLHFEIAPSNLIKTNILLSFDNMCNFLTSNMKDKKNK